MSAINGIGANQAVQKLVSQPIQKQLPAQPAAMPAKTDKVHLSGVQHAMQTLKAGGDIRADKVAAIRDQIKAGTYESEAKLDAALNGLMDDLAR